MLAKTPPTHPSLLPMTGTPRAVGGVMDVIQAGAATGNGSLKSYQGLYALWAFCHYARQDALATQGWAAIQSAGDQAVSEAARLCQKTPSKSAAANSAPAMEANELINALIGFARLGRLAGHAAEVAKVNAVLLPLVKERVAFPIANAPLYGRTDPALWYSLSPELRGARPAGGRENQVRHRHPGAADGRGHREGRFHPEELLAPGLGKGDQTSEQAVIYPQYPLAVFDLLAFVFADKPEDLAHNADIPWCTGDLYYIEKLTYTLWAYAGRGWEKLP